MNDEDDWKYRIRFDEQQKPSEIELNEARREKRRVLNEIGGNYLVLREEIIALLNKLISNSDKEYLFWPDRKMALTEAFSNSFHAMKHIDKILNENENRWSGFAGNSLDELIDVLTPKTEETKK